MGVMGKAYSVGVDVGGTKIAYGLFDERRELIAQRAHPAAQGLIPSAFMDGIVEQIAELCLENDVDISSLSGVGLGMPCFIRQPDGHIIKSSNIPTLNDFSAKAYLETALYPVRVELDNDGHAAALSEYRHGAGRGFEHMLYCCVSSGIGSTPIVDGKLFRGSYGFSGESGHMLITPGEGVECACGKRGCFMSWCSGHMIVKHIRNWIASGEETKMLELADGDASKITTHHIKQAYILGDPMAKRAVEQMQHYLSTWLFNIYVFTNINCFVLGGGLLKMGAEFWAEIERRFHELDDGGCEVFFKHAQMGDEAGIFGANELLYQEGEAQ